MFRTLTLLFVLSTQVAHPEAYPSSNPKVNHDKVYNDYLRMHPNHGKNARTKEMLRPAYTTQTAVYTQQRVPAKPPAVTYHRNDPRGFARPDYNYYSTCDAVLANARSIADSHPDIMKHETLSKTLNGYSTEMLVVTVDLEPLRPGPRINLLLNFGQHGREIVTSEVALMLLERLAAPGGPEQIARTWTHSVEHQVALAKALRSSIIKIIPMENVNGRRAVELGRLCERKNGRGVDTNRNWAVDWGKKERDYDPSEEYPGTAPLSEPEAALLHELLVEFKPHAWVNVHSGMEALFMPYDHQARIPRGAGAEGMMSILNTLNAEHCGRRCAVGSGGKSVGYLAHGTATDYIYSTLKVPIVFTWEIFGDQRAHFNDCFRMFNPVTLESYQEVVSNWANAFFTFIRLVPDHPDVPSISEEPASFQALPSQSLPVDPVPAVDPPPLPALVDKSNELRVEDIPQVYSNTDVQSVEAEEYPRSIEPEVERLSVVEDFNVPQQGAAPVVDIEEELSVTSFISVFVFGIGGGLGGSKLLKHLYRQHLRSQRRRRPRELPR